MISVSIPFNKQSQFELFPTNGSSSRPSDSPKQRFLLRSLTLSLENLVVLGIMMIMGFVISYSLGIEKGKNWQTVTDRSTKAIVRQVKTPMVPATATSATKPVAPTAPSALDPSPAVASAVSGKTLILTKPNESPAEIVAQLEKFYTIQVASYKGEKYAQKEADLLKQKGYDILVLPKGAFSIVCVGKFKEKEEAKDFSKKLKKQYKDCLIRSL